MWRMIGYSSVMPFAPRIAAGHPRDRDGLTGVVELPERHLFGAEPAVLLHPAELVREERALRQLDRHVGQLLLRQLERGDRPVETARAPSRR